LASASSSFSACAHSRTSSDSGLKGLPVGPPQEVAELAEKISSQGRGESRPS
jgi:hypothetical protein